MPSWPGTRYACPGYLRFNGARMAGRPKQAPGHDGKLNGA